MSGIEHSLWAATWPSFGTPTQVSTAMSFPSILKLAFDGFNLVGATQSQLYFITPVSSLSEKVSPNLMQTHSQRVRSWIWMCYTGSPVWVGSACVRVYRAYVASKYGNGCILPVPPQQGRSKSLCLTTSLPSVPQTLASTELRVGLVEACPRVLLQVWFLKSFPRSSCPSLRLCSSLRSE